MELRAKNEGRVLEQDKPEYYDLYHKLGELKSKLSFMKKDNSIRRVRINHFW
jgi:hypothetical protein